MIDRTAFMQIKRIASKANTRLKDWASLLDKKGRESLGQTIAEGARLAGEGLDDRLNPEPHRLRPLTLLLSDSGADHAAAGDLFRLAGEKGVERVSLTDDCFAKVTTQKNADGIALVLGIESRMPDVGVLLREGGRWLAADGVQDPGNAGALVRTALAAGFDGCIFIEGADPLSPKSIRGAMGALYRLPCWSVSRDDFVRGVTESGIRMLLADSAGGGVGFRETAYGAAFVLTIGGERGVSETVASAAAERIHVPLHGGVESLNLAVAAGVILFEAERQREQQ